MLSVVLSEKAHVFSFDAGGFCRPYVQSFSTSVGGGVF